MVVVVIQKERLESLFDEAVKDLELEEYRELKGPEAINDFHRRCVYVVRKLQDKIISDF